MTDANDYQSFALECLTDGFGFNLTKPRFVPPFAKRGQL